MSVLSKLLDNTGKYIGEGTNHDNEMFKGSIELKEILNGKGLEIIYTAIGSDGTCYHEEKTIITNDFFGNLKMWNLNSNSPGMTELDFRDSNDGILFGIGNKEDRNTFREEIKIEIGSKEIGYHYSWGMPQGDFEYRSGLIMKKMD